MTTAYGQTGAQVLQPQGPEDRSISPDAPHNDIWSNTFVETSSVPWLRTAAEQFSDALAARQDQVQHVTIIKRHNGRVDVPDSFLWLTSPHSFIDGLRIAETESGRVTDETADVVDAFERIRASVGATRAELFKATGIRKRTFHSWVDKPAGSRPRVASLGRLWELADAVDDLHSIVNQPLNRWIRGDSKRIKALLDGRFDDLVDLAVDRAPAPSRDMGASVYEGIAEDVEIPIIRSGRSTTIEDVEDRFIR